MGVPVRDDQRALELSRFLVVDAEVGRKVDGAVDIGRDIDEAAVAENRAVERRKVVVHYLSKEV